MQTSKHPILSGVLIAMAFIACAPIAHGQGREPARNEMRGILKAVDVGAATVTVAFSAGREVAPTEKTFSLTKNVEVAVGGDFGLLKEGKLADLTPGTTVGLTLTADQKMVDCIVAQAPIVRGTLKAIDAKKNTLTIAMARNEREPVAEVTATYTLAANADIAVDDGRGRRFSIKEGKVADLAEGASVTLWLSLNKTQINAVMAQGSTVIGVVKAIDAAKKSVTLTIRPVRGDEAAEERALRVSDDAVVLIDDGKGRRLSMKEGKLADVPIGAVVLARMSVDQGFAMMIRAEGPTLSGLLKGIDAKNNAITIAIPRGRDVAEEKTVTLAKEVRVIVEGKEATLADLKVGDNGPIVNLRLSLDQRTVLSVTAYQPRPRD